MYILVNSQPGQRMFSTRYYTCFNDVPRKYWGTLARLNSGISGVMAQYIPHKPRWRHEVYSNVCRYCMKCGLGDGICKGHDPYLVVRESHIVIAFHTKTGNVAGWEIVDDDGYANFYTAKKYRRRGVYRKMVHHIARYVDEVKFATGEAETLGAFALAKSKYRSKFVAEDVGVDIGSIIKTAREWNEVKYSKRKRKAA